MDDLQGQPILTDPAVEQGQEVVNPAVSVDPPQEVNTPPAVIQGAEQTPPQNDQHFQSLYNKALAEKWQLEQRLQKQMEFQQQQMFPKPAQQNPYDPQTQGTEWWRYEMQSTAKTAAEEARRATRDEFGGMLQQFQKNQWLTQHGAEMQKAGITEEHLRAFNEMKGILPDNYELGWQVMNMPTQMNNAVRQTQQQTINNFRQPNTGAMPVRGTQSATASQNVYDYGKMYAQFAETHGRVYDTWTPEAKQAFDYYSKQLNDERNERR